MAIILEDACLTSLVSPALAGGNQKICLSYHIILHVIVLLLLLSAFNQPNHGDRHATGALTVTALVTSSVSVTFAADGRPAVVVANAPADAGALARVSLQSRTDKSAPSDDKKSNR